jgi:hypothetical protein
MATTQRGGGSSQTVSGAPAVRWVARLGLIGILKEILEAGS